MSKAISMLEYGYTLGNAKSIPERYLYVTTIVIGDAQAQGLRSWLRSQQTKWGFFRSSFNVMGSHPLRLNDAVTSALTNRWSLQVSPLLSKSTLMVSGRWNRCLEMVLPIVTRLLYRRMMMICIFVNLLHTSRYQWFYTLVHYLTLSHQNQNSRALAPLSYAANLLL